MRARPGPRVSATQAPAVLGAAPEAVRCPHWSGAPRRDERDLFREGWRCHERNLRVCAKRRGSGRCRSADDRSCEQLRERVSREPFSESATRPSRTNSGSTGRDRRSLTEGEASAPRRHRWRAAPSDEYEQQPTRDAGPRCRCSFDKPASSLAGSSRLFGTSSRSAGRDDRASTNAARCAAADNGSLAVLVDDEQER
jgi:hypothetical protein